MFASTSARLADVAEVAVQFLDDIIDASRYLFRDLGEATRATWSRQTRSSAADASGGRASSDRR
jgi:hypothetical protein